MSKLSATLCIVGIKAPLPLRLQVFQIIMVLFIDHTIDALVIVIVILLRLNRTLVKLRRCVVANAHELELLLGLQLLLYGVDKLLE